MTLTGVRTLDGTTEAQVIEQFAFHYDADFSIPELARMAGLSPKPVRRIVKQLRKEKFVVKTRMIGITPMFRLNSSSSVAVRLAEFAHDAAISNLSEPVEIEADRASPTPFPEGEVAIALGASAKSLIQAPA
jgi:hypothetical protein